MALNSANASLLYFVERVALPVGAQADPLAQMVERVEVLLPNRVQGLKQQRLLDEAHQVRPHVGRFARHQAVRGRDNPLADLLLLDAVLAAPIFDRQVEVQRPAAIVGQLRHFPLLGQAAFGDAAADRIGDHLGAHLGDCLGHVARRHEFPALRIHLATLVVHHVVVFEDVLAHVEVARFDLLLRFLERLVDPGVDDRLAVLEAEALQHSAHALGPENPHQIVLKRQKEPRLAGIALSARAAA